MAGRQDHRSCSLDTNIAVEGADKPSCHLSQLQSVTGLVWGRGVNCALRSGYISVVPIPDRLPSVPHTLGPAIEDILQPLN